jgi:hypothetical protein
MPSKVRTWRLDEPSREPAYRAAHREIHDRLTNQDGCITWLLVELRALQKRVDKLEQRNAHTAANMVRAACERMDEVRELEQRGDLQLQETGDQTVGHPAPADGR